MELCLACILFSCTNVCVTCVSQVQLCLGQLQSSASQTGRGLSCLPALLPATGNVITVAGTEKLNILFAFK